MRHDCETATRDGAGKFLAPEEKAMEIVLVEDTHSDVMLTRIALDATQIPYNLTLLKSGESVMPYLRAQEKLPDVLMLDLGMPRVDGFEILAELAAAPPALRAIPVVIMTGYEDFDYLCKNSAMWVPAYINKPCNAAKIRTMLECIRRGQPLLPKMH